MRQRVIDLNTSAGSRVHMLKLPQKPTLPAVRVQVIDDPEQYHLRGGAGIARARVQVDSYAAEGSGTDPYETASGLADAIDGDDAGSGLSGFAGHVEDVFIASMQRIDRRPFYEAGELRLVRIQQDYYVDYRA